MSLTTDDIVNASREKYPKISDSLDNGEITSSDVVSAMLEKHPKLQAEYSPQQNNENYAGTYNMTVKAKAPSQDTIKPDTTLSKIGNTANDVLSQISYGVQDTIGMNPQGAETNARTKAGNIARTVGKVGGYVAPIPGVQLAGVNNDAINMGIKKASDSLSKAASPLVNAISGLTKKTASYIQGTLSSVTPEIYEHAITKEMAGQSIFKGKWNPKIYEQLGGKVQEAVNYIKDQAGKQVSEEKQAIKGASDKITTTPFVSSINSKVASMTNNNVSSLTNYDKSIIDQIKGLLVTKPATTAQTASPILDITGKPIITKVTTPAEQATADRLLAVKTRIDNLVSYSPQTVKKPSPQGERILKELRGEITTFLEKKYPQLEEVNAKFSQIANIRGRLLSKLKDENIARNLKNIYNKDDTTQSLFAELDSIAPKNLKFMDQLKDTIARQPFEELFPGRGGGSGGKEGFANILRIAGVAHDVALLPVVSPMANKTAIKTAGAISRAAPQIPKLIAKPATKQALMNYGLNVQ